MCVCFIPLVEFIGSYQKSPSFTHFFGHLLDVANKIVETNEIFQGGISLGKETTVVTKVEIESIVIN